MQKLIAQVHLFGGKEQYTFNQMLKYPLDQYLVIFCCKRRCLQGESQKDVVLVDQTLQNREVYSSWV